MSERWRIEPEYAVPVYRALGVLGVLLEPTTVVAKAWEQILAIGLGATYHFTRIAELGFQPDIVIECTGVPELVLQSLSAAAPGGVISLTGVGSPIAIPDTWNQSLATHVVLNNLVMFGSVNANRRHYYRAAKALARADRAWLEGLITCRVDPGQFERALERRPEDIKVVVQFSSQ
jgi:glucose 1-dehydrogenase